ncbi:hypothetical protein ACK4CJ_12010 [Enterococcus gallinarum]|uniref:hypothetical protein n=1 Tax=Enterococcus gallinarum TaxID=1353 RepID=UPI00391B95C0
MKKILYILLSCFLFVIVVILLYFGYFKYQEYTSYQKIDNFIGQTKEIPQEEILLVKDIYPLSNKYETYFSKDITTKKDFENWKKEITKTGKFYNGNLVPKDYIPTLEDCELIYSFIYAVENYGLKKRLSFNYIISGTSENSKKVIKENFAYPDIPFDYPEE